MSAFRRSAAAVTAAMAVVVSVHGQDGFELRCAQTVETGTRIVEHQLIDMDGDGQTDLLTVTDQGVAQLWRGGTDGTPLDGQVSSEVELPQPQRCLLALADVLGLGAPQLVSATPGGVVAYAFTGSSVEATVLSKRAAFRLRVGQPRFAEFVQDLNRDGRADLVIPAIAHPRKKEDIFEVWVNEAGSGDASESNGSTYRMAARVPMRVRRETKAGVRRLSDVLESSFSIPTLRTRDVNGDGRQDLLVENRRLRAFHMQRADGSLPAEPDVTIDLEIFRDTTPEASVRPGRTLVASDRQQYATRDLDGDDIPDYVIAHRRKVWVFFGDENGPQFTSPSAILKTADDITFQTVIRLDKDAYPDLLIVKVVVPTVATLLMGMIGEWEVELYALGYANLGGRKFETQPRWKSSLAIRLPAILDVMRDPEAILQKFEGVERSFRRDVRSDFDGDKREDVALLSEDETRLEAWRGETESAAKVELDEGLIREVLFDDDDKVWNIDRILSTLAAKAEERVTQLTGGRPSDTTYELRAAEEWSLVNLASGDLNGDGRAEIVAIYERATGEPVTVIDVLSVGR